MDPSFDTRSESSRDSNATVEATPPAGDATHLGDVVEESLHGRDWQLQGLAERVQEDLVGRPHASVPPTAERPRKRHPAMPKRLDALDLACERAAQVQVSLTEFVNKLADVGDASEEKISLLLETLDAGAATRTDLQKLVAEAARQTQRFDKQVSQHDTHISELARTTIRRIEEAVREQTGKLTDCRAENAARLEETLRTHLTRLEHSAGDCKTELTTVADQHVRDIHREHDARAQDVRKLEEAVREKESRLSSQVDDGLRQVDAACRGYSTEIDAAAQACIGRLTETAGTLASDLTGRASACQAEIAKREESSRDRERHIDDAVRACEARLTELADLAAKNIQTKLDACTADAAKLTECSREQERRIDGAAQACETRLTELAETVTTDLRGKLDNCAADAAQHAADVRQHSTELGELSGWCVKEVRNAAREALDTVRTRQEAIQQQTEQWEEAGNRQVQRIEEATGQSIAAIKEAVRVEMAELSKAAAQQLERFGPTGAETVRLTAAIDRATATIETETEGQIAKLVESGEQATARLGETVDAKAGQLTSQLQAASEAVRMVSSSTRGAHTVLDQLIAHREHIDDQVKTLDAESVRATAAATALADAHERVAPTLTAVGECLEGSDITIKKIERLIEDVWTVSTTAQKRAQQLTQRCNDATATGMKVEGMGKELTQLAEKLAHLSETSGDHVTRLDDAEALAANLIERIEGSSERASHAADAAQQAAQSADAAGERLNGAVSDGAESAEKLTKSIERSQGLSERLEEQNRAAQALVDTLTSEGEGMPALMKQLRSGIKQAERVSHDVEETLTVGSKIKQQLDESTQRANEVSRDAAQMLATLIERRDVLEASDRALGEFLERAERLHGRLQQLQTRADAFNHQLNGMLADPQRIIDEAKTQAGQLDGVCRAVRKVFSGLSQASLQANRDITRFAKISREANAKLTQLSSETQRSGQTLREWVDEAVHAQVRLSKSLARVPPLSQTHPTTVLEDLATSSAEATAEILNGPLQQRSSESAADNTPTPIDRGLGTDFGALIREAERIAKPRKKDPTEAATPLEAGHS